MFDLIGELIEWGAITALVARYAGHLLLLAVAVGFPATMWALHRSPRVRWRFGVRDVVTLTALAIYVALLALGTALVLGLV